MVSAPPSAALTSSSITRRPFIRFGVFEVDPVAEELRKNGVKIKLRGQPFQVLAMLLEHPGELVTREQLQQRLWPDGTFVDFDHSLNTAINKIREALGDSAENPRFVETLARRGYRFIAPVERMGQTSLETGALGKTEESASFAAPTAPIGAGRRQWPLAVAGGAISALLALLIALNIAGLRERLLRSGSINRIEALAVLPFENRSDDPEQEYFADGMTEALIADLSKISVLRIISRTSIMQFKGARKPLPEIARALKVEI